MQLIACRACIHQQHNIQQEQQQEQHRGTSTEPLLLHETAINDLAQFMKGHKILSHYVQLWKQLYAQQHSELWKPSVSIQCTDYSHLIAGFEYQADIKYRTMPN